MSKLILHNYVHTTRARAHDTARPARRVMVRDCGGDCDCSDCKDQRGRAYGNRDRTTERGWRAAVSAEGVGVIETSPLFISEQRARAWLDEQIEKLKRAGKRAWGTLRSSFEDPDRHADSSDAEPGPKLLAKLRQIGRKLEEATPNPRDYPGKTYREMQELHRKKWNQFQRVREALLARGEEDA